MKNEINVPSVGESITTGVVVSWLKNNGDLVKDGDMIFELETDKAVLEIPSPGAGRLEILVGEGTEVSIGTVKLKGRGHAIENIITTEDIVTETKKEIRQRKRLERREKR